MVPSILRPLLVTSFAIQNSFNFRSLSLTRYLKTFAPICYASSKRNLVSGMSTSSNAESSEIDIGYLNAKDAYNLDVELMTTPGFTLEQLMELAGLSVAQAVYEVSPPPERKILIICGPGNNGGDGLVAARHLMHFGHKCIVVYPKRPTKQPHYTNLVKSCEDLEIPVLDGMPEDLSTFDVIVDSIFGFSFTGTPREPFNNILKDMMLAQTEYNIPIVSVDVPSGWNVDEGDVSGLGFMPEVLISLTAPKLCSKTFKGRHFCGGRFLPPALAKKYQVRMPPYSGTDQFMELPPARSEEK
mmetsp:Transcript_24/g.34  ORF Transcript_24/g.34 Transcript_24/m.34 type:complete len:299 (+) Transcript_24:43-939(+)